MEEADRLAIGFDGVVTLRTSLDAELQKAAEEAVAGLIGEAGPDAEVALVAMRPNGQVVSMVGGRDYAESQYNRATKALRSPGSTFKTFVYFAALAQGLAPEDVIEDAPLEIDGYAPRNFDDRYRGRVTAAEAFARSLNTAAVRLALTVGLNEVAETARALGIEAELSETPALALGASGVALLDMVEAYASIASGMMPVKARGISGVDPRGDGTLLAFRWPEPPVTDRTAALLAARDGHGHAPGGCRERGYRPGGRAARWRARQDRHQSGLPRRAVHRLDRQPRGRGLDRARRQRAARRHCRRRLASPDLARLHAARRPTDGGGRRCRNPETRSIRANPWSPGVLATVPLPLVRSAMSKPAGATTARSALPTAHSSPTGDRASSAHGDQPRLSASWAGEFEGTGPTEQVLPVA
ncbi:penicillin binding protein [Hoeflea halophila]|uniref:Penicillin binding protein n=1 Tax=Hoeflea halophila TaxID=714899 RepID=A0A286I9J3_9HYPH|nr:penicillin-binding transpeptidase domain-containing protein [Hoeflea halophila]SOE16760.1 penicillin binding protein [Hoeflea halophila]